MALDGGETAPASRLGGTGILAAIFGLTPALSNDIVFICEALSRPRQTSPRAPEALERRCLLAQMLFSRRPGAQMEGVGSPEAKVKGSGEVKTKVA